MDEREFEALMASIARANANDERLERAIQCAATHWAKVYSIRFEYDITPELLIFWLERKYARVRLRYPGDWHFENSVSWDLENLRLAIQGKATKQWIATWDYRARTNYIPTAMYERMARDYAHMRAMQKISDDLIAIRNAEQSRENLPE